VFEVVDELDPVVDVEEDVGSVVDVVVEVVSSDCEAGAEVVEVVELVVLEVLDVVEVEEVEPVVDVVPLVVVVEPELADVVEVVEQDELDPVVAVLLEVVDVVELDEGEVVLVSVDCVSAMSFSWWWRDDPKGIARTSAVSPMVTEALMCQVLICLIGHRLAGLLRAKKVANFADLYLRS
jgi:hypothetical protein